MNIRQFLVCAVSIIACTAVAQDIAYVPVANDTHAYPASNEISISAQFPGGANALNAFFAENIVYGTKARRNCIEGTVKVQFTVGKDGHLNDFEIIESPHQLLSRSALATVKAMPAWNPSTRGGAPVTTQVVVPIQYKLK